MLNLKMDRKLVYDISNFSYCTASYPTSSASYLTLDTSDYDSGTNSTIQHFIYTNNSIERFIMSLMDGPDSLPNSMSVNTFIYLKDRGVIIFTLQSM